MIGHAPMKTLETFLFNQTNNNTSREIISQYVANPHKCLIMWFISFLLAIRYGMNTKFNILLTNWFVITQHINVGASMSSRWMLIERKSGDIG